MYTIGTHMSIAGGLAKTAENVVKMNGSRTCTVYDESGECNRKNV